MEREVFLVMSILAYKTRPGFSIKPWSASINHCGLGFYQLALSQDNVWASFGPHHVPGLFSMSSLDADSSILGREESLEVWMQVMQGRLQGQKTGLGLFYFVM